jgi:hypothetical protein
MAGQEYDVVEELIKRIERLEARVNTLENRQEPRQYNPLEPIGPGRWEPPSYIPHCSVCHRKYSEIDGFVCTNSMCPRGQITCNID